MRIFPIPRFPGRTPSKDLIFSCSRRHLILCDWVLSGKELTLKSLREICGDEASAILSKLADQGYAKTCGWRNWGLTYKGRQALALRKELTELVFDPVTCLMVRQSCKSTGPVLRPRYR